MRLTQKYPSRLAMLLGAGTVFSAALQAYRRRQRRISYHGRVVLIFGASRGLGLVLARQLAGEGARLALAARSMADLEYAEQEMLQYEAEVMVVPCDVQDQQQVDAAISRVVRRYGQIDVLMNVAGIVQVGPLEHIRLEEFENALAVHFWGPLYAMRAVLPYMRARQFGRIINISSIAGLVAVPHMTAYNASKSALVGLSDSFRAELAKDGIAVATVAPGLMRTGAHVNGMFKGRHRLEYAWFSILQAIPLFSTTAESAARQIIKAGRYGQGALVITPQARLLALFSRLFPNVHAGLMQWAVRAMPRPEPRWGDITKTGWESQSRWSPSAITYLSDRATTTNNELRGHAPIVLEE